MRIEPTGNSTIDSLNKKLADTYGCDVSSDNPRYRIVWSEHQTEYRHGKFEDYDEETGRYLRTATETRLCLKYPQNPDCWVLERFTYNEGNPDIPAKTSYEPIWVYGAANSDPNPDWPHTEILVNANMYIKRRQITKSEMQDIQDAKFLKEKDKFKRMIQNESEYLVGALVAGAAVSVPNKEFKKDKEDVTDK